MRRSSLKKSWFLPLLATLLLTMVITAAAVAQSPRNVIIFVCDGLRAGSVNPIDAPTLSALAGSGVRFANSHALFPTFTTPNASAIATGHFLGDTGDFSNVLFIGYPVFNNGEFGNSPGSMTPSVENDQVLGDIDDHFAGNYLNEETLLAYARENGYDTASVGKLGPTLIQDVTQGDLSPTTGTVSIPSTVIIDDATGRAAGVPLPPFMANALTTAGLGIVAPSRGDNGQPGNNKVPGTLVANVAQQQYFIDAVTKVILPRFATDSRPFALAYWSRDPDGTQHYQGDSLGSLTPGINGPTSRAAIRNVDNNLKQLLDYLRSSGLAANTDIFVTADHGFSTVSHYEIGSNGSVTGSYSASFEYKDLKGYLEVNTGFAPQGFLSIDLAHFLGLPLFDPDSQITVNGVKVYEPVDPAIGAQIATERQHPASGDGFIGGTGVIAYPTDASVVVAANGGSDLIYLPNGSPDDRTLLAKKIIAFLTTQDYVSGIFTDDNLGKIPGALSLSDIYLEGSTSMPQPAIVVNFRSFSIDPHNPVETAVTFADTALQEGQGQHGSFSRADTYNFMAAVGPDFKQNKVDQYPVSNADVENTLASILGFKIPANGSLVGRIATEALVGKPDNPGKVTAKKLRSSPATNGKTTILHYQQLNDIRYFDAAGFEGCTVGL